MIIDELYRSKPGDMLTIAGRVFMIQAVLGTKPDKTLIMTTTRLFIGRDGRPTNQLTITIEDLLNRLIVITRR